MEAICASCHAPDFYETYLLTADLVNLQYNEMRRAFVYWTKKMTANGMIKRLQENGKFYSSPVLNGWDEDPEHYMYYGWHPFRLLGFPLFWGWVNGTGMLMVGFLMHLIVPHLKGWMKLQLLLIVLFAFALNYGIIGWPYFAALNWKMSVPGMYAMTLMSLGFALITVWWMAATVATDSPLKSRRLATAAG